MHFQIALDYYTGASRASMIRRSNIQEFVLSAYPLICQGQEWQIEINIVLAMDVSAEACLQQGTVWPIVRRIH